MVKGEMMALGMDRVKSIRLLWKIIIVLMILLFVMIWGCERKITWSPTNRESIVDYIEGHPEIFYDYFFDTVSDTSQSPSFYREIPNIQSVVSFVESTANIDTYPFSYEVNLIDTIIGVFKVYDGGVWYDTSFTAVGRARAYFEKWGTSSDSYQGWLLREASHTIIYSINLFQPYFKLNVTSGSDVDYNYTSTDTSRLEISNFPLVLSVGETAYLRLTSIDKTNYVYLHYYDGSTLKKVRFIDSGSSLDAQFVVTGQSGTYRHFFVDIVDDGSVGPPPQNYRARTWGIIYRIQ